MEELLAPIYAEIERRGLKEATVSLAAVGNPSALKNLRVRRGAGTRNHPIENLQAVAQYLGLKITVGPPRDTGPITVTHVDGADYARIPVHEAELAAGNGANVEGEAIIDHLAFRRDWLTRIGVSASTACLARVRGDSMQPTIWAGDMILIDTARQLLPVRRRDPKDQRRPSIYALRDGDETRVKRAERPAEDLFLLVSDNPDYPPELRAAQEITILGKVAWWGHTVRD